MNSELEKLIEDLRALPPEEQDAIVAELDRRMTEHRMARMEEDDLWAV